jgi:hypothetical protein
VVACLVSLSPAARRRDHTNMDADMQGGCNGCGREKRDGADDDEYSDDDFLELETCEDCGWSVCEDCSVNQSRGPCRCLNSDMGNAYVDMDGPKWYMGSNGGARYSGPFKCAAQREMEAQLMMDHIAGGKCLTECCFSECRKELGHAESKLCTRCRSAIYCSVQCQKAAWTTPYGVHGTHKQQCGAHLPPEKWPYISRDFKAYHEHWGRYPTAKPSAAQHAAAEALAEGTNRPLDADEHFRRAYLGERDALLAQAGLPTAAELAGEAPPQSPATPVPMEQGPVQSRADAAARAVELLRAANPAERIQQQREDMEEEEEEEEAPMSQAQASARAMAILNAARRDFGRNA